MASIIRSVADLGARIKVRRKALGYSQARVASLCDTGTHFISDLENGKETLELGKAIGVATTLGIDLKAEYRGLDQ
jgi:HTH-type transcriptional regulator/antitoxin HipB